MSEICFVFSSFSWLSLAMVGRASLWLEEPRYGWKTKGGPGLHFLFLPWHFCPVGGKQRSSRLGGTGWWSFLGPQVLIPHRCLEPSSSPCFVLVVPSPISQCDKTTVILDKHTTVWATPPALFALVIFRAGSRAFARGQPGTVMLLRLLPT
jgi:hypothetical protein